MPPGDREAVYRGPIGVDETVEGNPDQKWVQSVLPEISVEQIPETPIVVDSFPPTSHTRLDAWVHYTASAGYFDGVYRTDDRSPLSASEPVDGDVLLLVSGWTGDPQLGLKLHDVLLSQCDRIIARSRAVLERPDVADAVHPNLDRSGWEAIIHTGDFAVCPDPTLQAWAVLPGRPAALLPLNGWHRVAAAAPMTQPAYHVSALPPLLPDQVPPPEVSEIEVTGSRVNLRRCGGLDCRRIAQIGGGRYRVHIADRRNDWSLLVFGDRAGWMADKLYRAAE